MSKLSNRWNFSDNRQLQDFVIAILSLVNGNLDSDNIPALSAITDVNTAYIGDFKTDGSWRFVISGGNLSCQKRESAVWVEKGSFLA